MASTQEDALKLLRQMQSVYPTPPKPNLDSGNGWRQQETLEGSWQRFQHQMAHTLNRDAGPKPPAYPDPWLQQRNETTQQTAARLLKSMGEPIKRAAAPVRSDSWSSGPTSTSLQRRAVPSMATALASDPLRTQPNELIMRAAASGVALEPLRHAQKKCQHPDCTSNAAWIVTPGQLPTEHIAAHSRFACNKHVERMMEAAQRDGTSPGLTRRASPQRGVERRSLTDLDWCDECTGPALTILRVGDGDWTVVCPKHERSVIERLQRGA